VYTYVYGSPAEIQTPTHWNITGHNMASSPPVFSLSRVLTPPSSQISSIPASKNFYPRFKFAGFSFSSSLLLKIIKSEFM
jgi:hypothetical protein